MNERELRQLLASEIERRLPQVGEDHAATRGVLHAVRGSAAMAGESDLALVLGQLGARIRAGEAEATGEVRAVLEACARRLAEGQPAFASSWPSPPAALVASRGAPSAEYVESMRERLAALEAPTGSHVGAPNAPGAPGASNVPGAPDEAALAEVYRAVHGLKSAASAEGDSVTAWYCHGLEEHLEAAREGGTVTLALGELPRHRAVLIGLVEEPARVLQALQGASASIALASDMASVGSDVMNVGQGNGSVGGISRGVEGTAVLGLGSGVGLGGGPSALMVPEQLLDTLLDGLRRLDRIHDDISRVLEISGQVAARARAQREQLGESLRLIGPPRPWGAPEAALRLIEGTARSLNASSAWAGRGVTFLNHANEQLRAEVTSSRSALTQLRRTHLKWLLGRLEAAALELAEQQGKRVRVRLSGGDLPVDRRLAERLLDPALQLVRNSVTHGVASDARGEIWIQGERIGGWLRLTVEDDGAGLDVTRLRQVAGAPEGAPGHPAGSKRGARGSRPPSEELAFASGISTRKYADLFAGRGVGLAMAEASLTRLGGTLHLTSRAPRGARAIVEVPAESGLLDVLWVGLDELRFALPVMYARRVVRHAERLAAVSLATCLGAPAPRSPLRAAVELEVTGRRPVYVAVTAVEPAETVNVHPVPPRVARRGPYAGAALRRGGQLALVLHGPATALRAQGYTTP
ncbi:MAG: hypothetical protein KIT72_07185 [Polyangiaceae bacterium]|nr:hypothetical protein [Polyangiaceae bacterium]MCW5790187.1 hypothetical protein [Polyangiaceae bacterium]